MAAAIASGSGRDSFSVRIGGQPPGGSEFPEHVVWTGSAISKNAKYMASNAVVRRDSDLDTASSSQRASAGSSSTSGSKKDKLQPKGEHHTFVFGGIAGGATSSAVASGRHGEESPSVGPPPPSMTFHRVFETFSDGEDCFQDVPTGPVPPAHDPTALHLHPMSMSQAHTEGLCTPCPVVLRDGDCPHRATCEYCHLHHKQWTVRRPCKKKRDRWRRYCEMQNQAENDKIYHGASNASGDEEGDADQEGEGNDDEDSNAEDADGNQGPSRPRRILVSL